MDDAFPVLGIVALLSAKFFAYAWFFRRLAARWQVQRNPWGLALARMALGAAIAAAIWAVFPGDRAGFLSTYFAAIGAGRVLAWGAVIAFAFGRNAKAPALAGAIALGVALSYAVEIPVALGLVSALGGIC
jgi:hypothetical protein